MEKQKAESGNPQSHEKLFNHKEHSAASRNPRNGTTDYPERQSRNQNRKAESRNFLSEQSPDSESGW
jgi:hypothetical protein